MVTERKEKSPAPQRPWMVLVEHTSRNGARSLVETTVMGRLNPSLKDYLRKEAQGLGVQIDGLIESIQKVSKKKTHGKKKGGRRVRDERKALNKELTTILTYKEVLDGERHNPLLITLKDDEAVGWGFPDQVDSKWMEFVRDKNPEILDELSQDEIFLVHEVFSYRYQIIRQDREWLKNEFRTFFDEEVIGNEKLGEHVRDWIKKVTAYFSKS